MFAKPSLPVELPDASWRLRRAIEERYRESGAQRFGISQEHFRDYVFAVVARYGAELSTTKQMLLVDSLRVEELVLVRACSDGNEDAWREFVARFHGEMTRAAIYIVRNDGAAHELVGELYADLYGLPNREGRRVSKFDSYMGRGSLAGWLRSVLAQRFVDRCRSHAKETSLEEQTDAGVSFPVKQAAQFATDDRLAEATRESLKELRSEDRFLLAAYFLDGQKLATIGQQLGVHESTVSRKLEKLTSSLRKQVRKHLLGSGLGIRQCDELLEDLDVRDLNVDVQGSLQQETKVDAF